MGKLREFDRAKAIRLRAEGWSLRAIAAEMGIPMRTIYDCVCGIPCPSVGKTLLLTVPKRLKLKEPPRGKPKLDKGI